MDRPEKLDDWHITYEEAQEVQRYIEEKLNVKL